MMEISARYQFGGMGAYGRLPPPPRTPGISSSTPAGASVAPGVPTYGHISITGYFCAGPGVPRESHAAAYHGSAAGDHSSVGRQPFPSASTVGPSFSTDACNFANSTSMGAGRLAGSSTVMLTPLEAAPAALAKRQRREKRKISAAQKDERYYARRRQNNMAAKRCRDARKREAEERSLKAAALERENHAMRSRLESLRNEHRALNRLYIERMCSAQRDSGPAGGMLM